MNRCMNDAISEVSVEGCGRVVYRRYTDSQTPVYIGTIYIGTICTRCIVHCLRTVARCAATRSTMLDEINDRSRCNGVYCQ